MVHLPQTKFFLENYYYDSHLPISPFHCAKFWKTSSSGFRVLRMCNFWTQKGPFPQMRIFFPKNPWMSLVSFTHAYLQAKNQSQILIYYWNILIGRETFLAITWDLDFSQACHFRRMLMNNKNFRFTQIPDNTNDMIFLKSPKTLFLGHFWSFLPDGDFFQETQLCHT